MKKLVILAVFSFSTLAMADQCEFISRDSASTAKKLIELSQKNTGKILSFCQNCGDVKPMEITENEISEIETDDISAPVILIIGRRYVDLAYTYVNISNGVWVNLGKMSNCSNRGASQFISEKNVDGKIVYIPSEIY